MNPENYGVISLFVMHWQQWFMAVVTLCNLAVIVTAPTTPRRIIAAVMTLMIFYALWSAGFYMGGIVP